MFQSHVVYTFVSTLKFMFARVTNPTVESTQTHTEYYVGTPYRTYKYVLY